MAAFILETFATRKQRKVNNINTLRKAVRDTLYCVHVSWKGKIGFDEAPWARIGASAGTIFALRCALGARSIRNVVKVENTTS